MLPQFLFYLLDLCFVVFADAGEFTELDVGVEALAEEAGALGHLFYFVFGED